MISIVLDLLFFGFCGWVGRVTVKIVTFGKAIGDQSKSPYIPVVEGCRPVMVCGARGIASGQRTVISRKGEGLRRQAVEVRRLGLRMPAEGLDPIIKIIDRNEENIGPRAFPRPGQGHARQADEKDGLQDSCHRFF